MNYSEIFIIIGVVSVIALFIRAERLERKAEMARRLREREENARKWEEELKETAPDLYEKVFGKKNLH